jgi:hypothetical protein
VVGNVPQILGLPGFLGLSGFIGLLGLPVLRPTPPLVETRSWFSLLQEIQKMEDFSERLNPGSVKVATKP